MRSELGYREKSGQYTKFGEWYADRSQDPQYRNAPWCDMFIAWAAQKAGIADYVGQFAWTPSHASWFIKQGAWSSVPEPGALVFYDWSGGKSYKGIDHVGIVERVEGGKIHTIEANVDRVWLKRKFRDTEKVVGYGLPRKIKALRDVQPSAPVLVDDAPLQTFTVVGERGGSPFDLLGTPQALLALMVITTIVVSFRFAGTRAGRHRRGVLKWLTPAPATPQAAKPKPPTAAQPSAATKRPTAAEPKPPAKAKPQPATGKPAPAVARKPAQHAPAEVVRVHQTNTRRKPYETKPRPVRRDTAPLGK
ncbi:CHAP domain-containing protein [Nonomuraea sp. NPDC050556]|uniref:CHAP domain-containing protein n=1 Tax=Nonomuraea sp. NPDC050556 TaxID=3364369 RepID=UPI0037BD279A